MNIQTFVEHGWEGDIMKKDVTSPFATLWKQNRQTLVGAISEQIDEFVTHNQDAKPPSFLVVSPDTITNLGEKGVKAVQNSFPDLELRQSEHVEMTKFWIA